MEITNDKIKPAWVTGKCQKCGKLARFMIVMLCDECIVEKVEARLEKENEEFVRNIHGL